MSTLGYPCNPQAGAARTDIIQAVTLGDPRKVEAFCRAVQRFSPVGSTIVPEPGVTPGYGDEVIFADGTFIDGSTLELSADGPLRPPYAVYLQGGTHWTHWAIVLEHALESMAEEGLSLEYEGPSAGTTVATFDAASAEDARLYAGRKTLRNK